MKAWIPINTWTTTDYRKPPIPQEAQSILVHLAIIQGLMHISEQIEELNNTLHGGTKEAE